MGIKNLHIKHLLIAVMLLLPKGVWAQSETDSLLRYATQQIYENPATAIKVAQELLNETDAPADIKVEAILIISTAYSSKREYEKSMQFALSAMDLLPKLKNENLKINLFNRIGGIYQELRISEKAILYLDKALESINKLPEGEEKSRNLGANNLLRGFVYRQQMSCEIALDYFEKGIEEYKKIPNIAGSNANISNSYYNRGNCFIDLGRIKDAERSFLQSIEYAEKVGAITVIAFAQKGLAQVYALQEEHSKAISLLTDALHNSEKVGDKVLNRALYNALATNYLALDDLQNYSRYQNKSILIHEQITKAERKTVDDSIKDLTEANLIKIETVQNRTKTFQITLSTLILLTLIFMIRHLFLSQKRLKSLKNRLKF